MMPRGVSGKTSRIAFASLSSGTVPVPIVSTRTETGSATPIAYATWISHALGEAGGDDVLRDVARHVAGRAVDLRRVLARERAAAVAAVAAVGVDDDLAAREAGVALRPADDEAAGRVDEELGVLVEQRRRDHRLDDLLEDVLADRLGLDQVRSAASR